MYGVGVPEGCAEHAAMQCHHEPGSDSGLRYLGVPWTRGLEPISHSAFPSLCSFLHVWNISVD